MLKLGIKKVLAVLLSVLFVVSLTAAAANADRGDHHRGHGDRGHGFGFGDGFGFGGFGMGYGGFGGCGMGYGGWGSLGGYGACNGYSFYGCGGCPVGIAYPYC